MNRDKQSDLGALREEYGTNKVIPEEFEHAALIALSHYPELKKVHIDFVIHEQAIFPYASRPYINDFFRAPQDRRYQIIIADQSKTLQRILLKNLPFSAQVGILGHELAHTSFYLRQKGFRLLKTGLFYFLPSFRERFEKETDRSAITHGLGENLYKYSTYIRSVDGLLERNPWIEKYYLKPEEIVKAIGELLSEVRVC